MKSTNETNYIGFGESGERKSGSKVAEMVPGGIESVVRRCHPARYDPAG
jgi:hypothetical protein